MKDTEVIKKSEEIVREFIELLAIQVEVKLSMEVDEEDQKFLNIQIEGEDIGSLIGYRGRTLNSIQLLVSQMISNKFEERVRVLVDVNNYRQRREEYLISLGKKAANQAMENQQSVELPPLSAFERRIIHMSLKDEENVETESEGVGKERHIIVKYKK